jgi:hypothetical protein
MCRGPMVANLADHLDAEVIFVEATRKKYRNERQRHRLCRMIEVE